MKRSLRLALFSAAALFTQVAAHAGEITLFSDADFRGRDLVLRDGTRDLSELGFNDRTSSMVVRSGRWEVCSDADFRGRCVTFERGEYRTMEGFNDKISSLREVRGAPDRDRDRDRDRWERDQPGRDDDRPHGPPPRQSMVELFEGDAMRGRAIELRDVTPDLNQVGFNDKAVSLAVRGGAWEFCTDSNFRGRCVVLQPGDYRNLDRSLWRAISSARPVRR